jgi:hypothetical protein
VETDIDVLVNRGSDDKPAVFRIVGRKIGSTARH